MAVAEAEAESPQKKVFSEAVGARHLLICNVIKNAIDPVSGKDSQKIVAQVFDKVNINEALGEKTFIWPEDEIPEFLIEQNPSLMLVVKGKKNIAQLPFRVPRHSLPKCPVRSKVLPPVACKSSFNGSIERIDGSQSLSSFASEFVSKLDEERWKTLVQKCSSDNLPKPLPFVSVTALTDEEQLKLIDALQKKLKTKQQEGQVLMVVGVLLKQNVFTTTSFPLILKHLIEAKCYKLLHIFVKSPLTLIMDDIFVSIAKFTLELKDEQSLELFVELVSKGFTSVSLREQFAKQFTPKEAVQLLNLGVNVLDQKASNDVICEKVLDLLLALIDSHCDKLVWEDDSYAALKRTKDYIQSMTEMTTAFTRLLSKNKARSEMPELEAPADTDFVIEKVKFHKTVII